MAKCKTNKSDRNLNSLIEFAPLINKVSLGQTVDQTIEFLDKTTNFTEKQDTPEGRRYALKNSLLTLRHTVTEILFKGGKKPEENNNTKLGHFIHEAYEDIFNTVIKHGDSYKDHLSQIKTKFVTGKDGFKLNAKQFDDLVGSVDLQLKEKQKIQDSINKRTGTKGKLTFRAEQRIVDVDHPDGGIGGTIDCLVIYSNNTASILDVKTSGFEITDKKMQSIHQPQLSLYKKILIKNYGFDDIITTDIIPVLVKMKPGTKIITSFTVLTDKIHSDKVKIKPGEFNKTGFKELDKWIKAQYNFKQGLQQKLKSEKSPAKKKEYYDQIQKLDAGIKHFLEKESLSGDIEYIKTILVPKVEARLKKDFYNGFVDDNGVEDTNSILKDLQEVMDELSIYKDLSRQTAEFMETNLTKEEQKKFGDTIFNIVGWTDINLFKLEEKRTKIALPDVELGPMKELGFFERNLTRFSDINNPIFKKASNTILEMERKKDLEFRRISEKLDTVNAKVKLWAKNNNISHTALVKLLMNDKGVYHNKLSKESMKSIREAWDKENSDALKQMYYIKPFWEEQYLARLEQKKKDTKAVYGESEIYEQEIKNYEETFDLRTSNKAWTNSYNKKYIKLKDSFVQSNLSEEYKKMLSIPELKDWYDTITDFNEDAREMLGAEYKEIPDNFYPNVRAETMELLLKDPTALLSSNKFLESMIVQEDDTAFYQYNQQGELKEVPKYFINPIDAKMKSYDILNSTLLFAKMAVHYRFAKEYEATMMAYRATLANSMEEVTTLSGKSKYDYAADKISRKLDSGDTLRTFDKLFDYFIYSIGTQDKGRNFNFFGTEVNSTKVIQAGLNKTRQMALGLNFVAGIAGGVAASMSMYVNSFKNGVVTRENIKDARIRRATKPKHSLGILAYLDGGMETQEQRNLTKNKAGIRKWVNERMLYLPFIKADESVAHTQILAMTDNYGLDSEGNIKRLANLPEGTKSLYQLLEKFDLDSEEGLVFEGYTKEQSNEIASRFRQMTRRSLYNITGSQASEDIYTAKTSLLGQVLMQFKSWMPGVVSERSGIYKVDNILDVQTVGRYRAINGYLASPDGEGFKKIMSSVGLNVWKAIRLITTYYNTKSANVGDEQQVDFKRINLKRAFIIYQQMLLERPELVGKVSFQEFVNTYEGQLRALAVELRILIGFFLAVLLMGLGEGEDDPLYKQNQAYRVLYKVSRKTLSEMMYFFNPTSLTDLVGNGIPLAKTFAQGWNIVTNGLDSTRDIVFGQESDRDKTPPMYYTIPFLLPGFKGMRSILEPYDQDKIVR